MAKQYEVIGSMNIHGFDPGQKFHADLDEKHEARMLKGGFLRVVSLKTVKEPPVVWMPETAEPTKDEEE